MYICTKKIKLSGHDYVPGDIIDDNDVVPQRVADLVRWGCIAVSEAGKPPVKNDYKDVTVKDTKPKTETKEAVKPVETKPAEAKTETKEKAKKAVKEV